MENKRKFGRFDTQLEAQYVSKESTGDEGECTVINMSRKGIGVRFHARKKINIGSTINLEVFVPEKLEPANVEGVLKWIEEEKEGDLVGGIELDEVLDEMKFSKLA